MTDSHSVGPQVHFEDLEENTLLQFHSQNTSVLLATLWENRKSLPPHPFGILCRFFAPRNQIPSIPVVPRLFLCQQLAHVSFLSLMLSRMGEPGDAAVPLKRIWRWRSERPPSLSWAWSRNKVWIAWAPGSVPHLILVKRLRSSESRRSYGRGGPSHMTWVEKISLQRVGVAQLPVLGQKSWAVLMP